MHILNMLICQYFLSELELSLSSYSYLVFLLGFQLYIPLFYFFLL